MNTNTHNGPEAFWGSVVIRLATAGDRPALRGLAELDSARPPAEPALIGELHGRPVAAISLADGQAIADPFVATSEILELLSLRARQLKPRRAVRAAFATHQSTRTPLVRSLRLLAR